MPLLKPGRWSVNRGEIDLQYLSFWRDLVFVLKPGESSVGAENDLYAKHVTWGGSGLVSEPTQWGSGWRGGTSGATSGVTLPLDIDTCSVLVVADWDDNGTTQNCLIKRTSAIGSRSFFLVHNTDGTIRLGTNAPSADFSDSVRTIDGPVVVVVTNDGADASTGTKFYFDGVLDSSDSGVTGNDNTSLWVFGQRADDSNADLFDGRLVLGVVWDRILSAAEVNLLQLDPFGFIRLAPFAGGLTVTLYATGDGTITDLEDEGGATTGLWASIDDDPATPTDTDWINNINELSGGDASGFFEITDMPGDWGNAEGGSIVVRVAGNDVASTHKMYVRLFKSDETTTISDEVELVDVSTSSGQTNYSGTITGVSTTATKAEWDAARIRLRFSAT